MSLVIHREHLSLNYDPEEISVEFLVLHYTAMSLSGALQVFQNPRSRVSCHLIVDTDGSVYELVSCLDGKCFRAWHAGESYWPVDKHNLQSRDKEAAESRQKLCTRRSSSLQSKVVVSPIKNLVQKFRHAFCRRASLQSLRGQSRTRFE